ncbi:NAD-dependent epimerase/dehydratase [Micromonospora sp. WMMA1363]|uniref:NAD-dependent epimerase/dehydratase family protein n=1 Tax=Micromonospora sp. WMMA1363 TaxID=3053985 RepID=UPI00259D0CA7|nr:NAD-dependent epimerase/dehydratase [Micromonospora sp. WMMA1363]MDM4722184.1 NAD-dependent epimerase/dehydratase [Micromonospora sp. WMMA1363]
MAVNRPLIVLLGATGFVGSAVLRGLAARDVRVRAVSRRAAPVPADARAEVEVHTADLTEPGRLAEAVAGADAVIHTIAYIAGSTTWRINEGDSAAERVNVGLVRDLVAVLRDDDRTGPPLPVVFAGAASQVGPTDKEVLDGSEPDRPKGEYDRQKLAAERVLLDAHAEGLLRAVSIRLPTVFGYGPRSTARDKGVVSTMVRRALAGEPITMWHDGTVRRDLLYIEDVARALVAAVDHVDALAGRAWLLGSGRGLPLGEVFTTVADLVADRTGKPPVRVVSVPPPPHAEPGDFHSVTIDATAFQTVSGWRPQVPLTEALRRTVNFCASGAEEGLS